MAEETNNQKGTQSFFQRAANRVGRFGRGVLSVPLLVVATAIAAVGYTAAGLVAPILLLLSAASPGGDSDLLEGYGAPSNKSIPEKESVLDKLYRYSKEGLTLGGKFEEKPGAGDNFVTGVGRTVGYATAGGILGTFGGPGVMLAGLTAGVAAGGG